MHVNLLPVTLCLLGTVVLCGAQKTAGTELPLNITTTAEGPNATVTPVQVTTPENSTDYTTQNSTNPSNSTELPGTSVVPPTTATKTTTGSSDVTITTPRVGDPSGLSDGAIAGIVIGSIAGVGGVGAGIFGFYKYKMKN
ncbi:mucin-13-like [Cheilinus undulatus]|uniref:mucin-13-like n=1 Tax=Cheilinus undulatus TaxID=241271 RepID=UPI001BD28428|nr:mucin-13-like [Cheilinus undulatus]